MQHTHKGTGIPLYYHILVSFHTHKNRLPVEPSPHVFPDECAVMKESFIYGSIPQPQEPSPYEAPSVTIGCYAVLGPPDEAVSRGQSGGRGTEPNHYTEQHVYEDADKVITVLYSPIHLYCLYNTLIYIQALLMLPMLNMKQPWSTKRESSFKTNCMWCWLLLCAGATLSTMCHVGLRLLILVKTMLNQMMPCLVRKSMRHNLRWWSEGILSPVTY